ncbi:signal peptidase I [Carnobacterium divergens]|uniref:signal peptidase I n=1 Tax=Carnobacterium divergens TaxID=2748 RepID=UPI00288D79DF|nr:signal peptidase I [Carnobacterium divergens]MDT2012595.1 signal peptidase I [Carnobacterium divergens]
MVRLPQKNEPSLVGDLMYLFVKVVVLTLLFILLFTFVFGIHRVENAGMSPSVKEGDILLFYRLESSYHSGDIVVLEKNKEKEVMRIVAVSGDEVDITKDGLIVNGHPQYGLEKSYVMEDTEQFVQGITFPVILKRNEFFVLGDNRGHAEDSRIYGPVSTEEIQGEIMTVIRRRDF